MALSNWDSCAFNEKGEPTDGVFKSPSGVEFRIYKNWLYVSDKKAWAKKGPYVQYTVGQITHGFGTYKDVTYIAVRGPKDGVYCAVWSTVYPKRSRVSSGNCIQSSRVYGMVGIGCRGYGSKGRYLGIKEREIAFLRKLLRGNKKEDEDLDEEYDHDFLPKEFVELNLSKAKRFNQGDGVFEEKLCKAKRGAVFGTKPGKADRPMLEQALWPKKGRKKK